MAKRWLWMVLAALAAPMGLLLPACGGGGDISLPAVFSDHAVFQRDKSIAVWGMADPGRRVAVHFGGQCKGAVAGDGGRWRVYLDPVPAGGPHELKVSSGLKCIQRKDILVGEVWVCSGQSNMEWPLSLARGGSEEVADANWPQMRLFTVPKKLAEEPRADVEGEWSVCTPQTAGGFSAIGYFFGRRLHKELRVPVGLINSSWGGSPAECWTPRWYAEEQPGLASTLAEWDARYQSGLGNEADRKRAYDEAMRKFQADWATFTAELEKKDQGAAGQWYKADLDPNGWKQMDLPTLWEQAGLANFDGVVWFRKEVDVPAGWAGKDLLLGLGPIDDDDVTYFNGQKVGAYGYGQPNHWTTPRRYKVPGERVKAGRNVIAVRVLDGGGGGGIYGQPAQMRLTAAGMQAEKPISLAGPWQYRVGFDSRGGKVPAMPQPPGQAWHFGFMYNAMIAPLAPYGIGGWIWYQGESNADRAAEYRALFPKMIEAWRRVWDEGDVPFLFVQLANFMAPPKEPDAGGWAWVREAQVAALKLPKVGMAVTIDIGEANDIHPRNKQDVGGRLALAALAIAYGRDVSYRGPTYQSMAVEGDKVRIRFRHADDGLVAKDGPLKQFAVAGKDRAFVWAEAKIDGNSVVVWSDKVKEPAAVRYAWASDPEGCNLYNGADLPAVPFRTDDWPPPAKP